MDPITAKELKDLFDNIPSKDSVVSLLDGIKGIDGKLADLGKAFEPEDKPDPEVTLEKKGWFDDIMSFEFQGIPVGQAAVGGFAAIFASELVDGFMADSDKWKRGLVKLAIAAISVKFGQRILGSTGAKAVALLLTFDAIRDLSPIDSWADQLAERISGRATTAGLAGNEDRGKVTKPSNQREEPAGYYAMALGGGR